MSVCRKEYHVSYIYKFCVVTQMAVPYWSNKRLVIVVKCGISPWWSLLGQLHRYPIPLRKVTATHLMIGVPVDFIYGYPILNELQWLEQDDRVPVFSQSHDDQTASGNALSVCSCGALPTNTVRNKNVTITSKRCFDVMVTFLLRIVFPGML